MKTMKFDLKKIERESDTRGNQSETPYLSNNMFRKRIFDKKKI